MLDPIISFFQRGFSAIGAGFGWVVAILLSPFIAVGRWYTRRGWILRGSIGLFLMGLVVFYGDLVWKSQVWTNFDKNYAATYTFDTSRPFAGGDNSTGSETTCRRSAIATVAADLTDFNVNQNGWISSKLSYKLGLFGIDWDDTPFLDNKASFQRGVNQAIRRTTVELVDTLGRVRGTSQIDRNLQDARGNLQFDESTWYFGINPFGPKTPTPSFYRSAIEDLNAFNTRLEQCSATFDTRGDNLFQFFDRIASDLGSTSDILRERSENYNRGWFDFRADDRFWFAYGQLYAYSGIIKAARADFGEVIQTRSLGPLFTRLEAQLDAALDVDPFIISNGSEDGWIMPTHLATMGFYVLRVRTNLTEIRDVLRN